MSIELVKAFLTLVRASCENCKECPLKEFCGKSFQSF